MQPRKAAESSEPSSAATLDHAFIPAYVISLPDAELRRRNMREQLEAAGVPFTFVDALYGRAAPVPDQIDGARVVRTMFKTEVGLACTVSHRLLHRVIAEGEAETALILEDDAIIPNDFVEVVEHALTLDFDVFKLEGVNASKRRVGI